MPRILLVEDNALICAATAEALADHGFDVHAAARAEDALHYLFGGAPVDILFTDINLGDGMDGAELARVARDLRPALAVIYASGTLNQVERAVPGSTFLPKPYILSHVCAMLKQMTAGKPDSAHSRIPPAAKNCSSQWMW